MTGRDVLKKIKEGRAEDHLFIKWNRKENDFADFDLIDRFVENLSGSEEFETVDFLTSDEMWRELKRVSGERVRINKTKTGDYVEWQHNGKNGETTQCCQFTADTLMTIFDVETRGDAIG